MSDINQDAINDLLQQVKHQCPNVNALVNYLNRRLEGELQSTEALTNNPQYQVKRDLFKQAGRYHPLLETINQQHKTIAEIAPSYLKHSYLEKQKISKP